MNKSTKIILLSGPAIFGFTMSATTPTVQLHFYKLVDESVYALAGVIYTSIAALSQSIMAKEQYRSKIKTLFGYILILDVLAFLGISIAGMEHVTLRFIGISVLS